MIKLINIIKQNWQYWLTVIFFITLLTLDFFETYQNKRLLGLSYISLAIAFYFATNKLSERRKIEGKELSTLEIFSAGIVAGVWLVQAIQYFIR